MRSKRTAGRGLAIDASGVAAVEIALAAPLLLAFILGIMEIGRALWIQNALSYSVAEAARCASVTPAVCGTTAQTQSYAADRSGSGINSSRFTVSSPACGKQVSATYPMALTIPFMNLSVNLTAQSCYPS